MWSFLKAWGTNLIKFYLILQKKIQVSVIQYLPSGMVGVFDVCHRNCCVGNPELKKKRWVQFRKPWIKEKKMSPIPETLNCNFFQISKSLNKFFNWVSESLNVIKWVKLRKPCIVQPTYSTLQRPQKRWRNLLSIPVNDNFSCFLKFL